MSMTRAGGLGMALDEFLRQSPDLEAAAVVSADGLPMASALPAHVEEDRLGAMAAALLSLGERASETLGKGQLQQVFVEGSSGYVFLMAAGNAVLCAITGHSAKIGLVLYEMHRAASAIARILDTESEQPALAAPAAPTPMAPPAAAPTVSPPAAPVPHPFPSGGTTQAPQSVPQG